MTITATEAAADEHVVQRATELLLNSLYPTQRGEVLRRLWALYNMDAPQSELPPDDR